jgi:hypothetical protein
MLAVGMMLYSLYEEVGFTQSPFMQYERVGVPPTTLLPKLIHRHLK